MNERKLKKRMCLSAETQDENTESSIDCPGFRITILIPPPPILLQHGISSLPILSHTQISDLNLFSLYILISALEANSQLLKPIPCF